MGTQHGQWKVLLEDSEISLGHQSRCLLRHPGLGVNAGGPGKETCKAAGEEVGHQEDSDKDTH